MFGAEMPEAQASYLSNAEALVKLVTDKTIDVAVVAAGQPAPIVTGMKPEAQKLIKFLKFDPEPSVEQAGAQGLRARHHPRGELPEPAHGGLHHDLRGRLPRDLRLQPAEHGRLHDEVRALAVRELPALQEKGHPKWKEVNLALPELNTGWTYYPPTAREIRACIAGAARARAPRAAPPSGKQCSREERILGLCN